MYPRPIVILRDGARLDIDQHTNSDKGVDASASPGEGAGRGVEAAGTEGWRFIVAAVGVLAISALGAETLPVLVGAMMDGLGLDAVRVGRIASVEMGAQALAALGLAPRIDRLDRRRLIVAAGCVAVLAHLGSARASSETEILALRGLAGLAEGTALAVVNAALAASRNPDRTYAAVALAGGILVAGLMGVLPLASEAWQHAGAFVLLAAAVLLALPAAARIPRGPRVGRGDVPSTKASAERPTARTSMAAAARPSPTRMLINAATSSGSANKSRSLWSWACFSSVCPGGLMKCQAHPPEMTKDGVSQSSSGHLSRSSWRASSITWRRIGSQASP